MALPLTLEERKVVEESISLNISGSAIARHLGRATACVNKDIRRGGGRDKYNALAAHEKASARLGGRRQNNYRILTGGEIEIIKEGIEKLQSITEIGERSGLDRRIIRRYFLTNRISYLPIKRNHPPQHSEIWEKITTMEMQIEIIIEELKRRKDGNQKN